jgi:hypothetical protein
MEHEPLVSELRVRLSQLQVERIEAADAGLADCPAYMQDLDAEICECRAAFVGAAVTEIAIVRADLSGHLLG